MQEFTFKNFPRDLYGIFLLVNEESRIAFSEMARRMKVDNRTVSAWWRLAVQRRIIYPPIIRRKSFLNFREYIYYLNVKDPSYLAHQFEESEIVTYYSVQTGFANFHIVAKSPIDFKDTVFGGERSDYYVSTPPNWEIEKSISVINDKLDSLNRFEEYESPLIYHNTVYESWDEKDELLYWILKDNMRKPFLPIMKEYKIYSDKIMKWIRRQNEFGNTIVMYYPEGEKNYLTYVYALDTDHDSLIIDLFSQLPASSIFYRLCDRLIMTIYVPFPYMARTFVRKVLSRLQKENFVKGYTNSIMEYSYRP